MTLNRIVGSIGAMFCAYMVISGGPYYALRSAGRSWQDDEQKGRPAMPTWLGRLIASFAGLASLYFVVVEVDFVCGCPAEVDCCFVFIVHCSLFIANRSLFIEMGGEGEEVEGKNI